MIITLKTGQNIYMCSLFHQQLQSPFYNSSLPSKDVDSATFSMVVCFQTSDTSLPSLVADDDVAVPHTIKGAGRIILSCSMTTAVGILSVEEMLDSVATSQALADER